MSTLPSPENVQKLIETRSKNYGDAFKALSVDGTMSWMSKDVEINDISLSQYKMDNASVRSFFTKTFNSISSMTVIEESTAGSTPDFVAWEMLLEVEYNVDEPALGLKKGLKARLRGVSLQWWRWEGKGGQWDGDLSEAGIRGWKIIRENDYFVTLKDAPSG